MFKYAISLVFRRKLRTFLTSLGITISVVLLSFIIFGMQAISRVITDEFSSRFKPNQLVVSNQDFTFGLSAPESTEEEVPVAPTFITPQIVEQISEEEFIEKVDAQLVITGFQIEIEDSKIKPFAPSFIGGFDPKEGTSYFVEFRGESYTLADKEAFVGNALVDYFKMTPEELIGKEIIMKPATSSFFSQKSAGILDKEYRFTVTGYIDSGIDRTDLLINTSAASNILAEIGGFPSGEVYLNTFGYDQVIVDVTDPDKATDVKDVIKEKYNLNAITSEDLISFLQQITVVLTLALTMFGLISSVVASIGIINTMVMSIYEQTREIGIIKAIGASNFQVMIVFLIQAGMIGLFGAIQGLLFVFIVMTASDGAIVNMLEGQGLTADHFFEFNIVIASVITLLSILVGILAGLYPALKAARLDPVKALRYE